MTGDQAYRIGAAEYYGLTAAGFANAGLEYQAYEAARTAAHLGLWALDTMDTPPPAPSSAIRFWVTFERIRRNEGIIALYQNGEWVCGSRVQCGRSEKLQEAAYKAACVSAASHGGIVDRFAKF